MSTEKTEPKSYGNGSGSNHCYIVEARTSYMDPQEHCGMTLDSKWRRVHFENSKCGVKVDLLHRESAMHGFLNLAAAMALAHWFMSEPHGTGFPMPNYCVETRIVEVKFQHSYTATEVGVGPTMTYPIPNRDVKFTPREPA